MKRKTGFIGSLVVGLIFVLSAPVVAQNREQYVISAKAGGVNSIFGDVALKRRGETQWQPLNQQDELDSGDMLRTGANGRVEILLNPGSYLRAGENSEVELTNASLDMLQLKLVKGSSIVEVAGADEARTLIEVRTPQTKVAIDRKGLYRIDVVAPNATEVFVRKGRAMIGEGFLATEVKDGKKIRVGDGTSVVTKFDKKQQDAFDLWSEQRAETLVAANRRLSNSAIARSYANYSRTGFGWRSGFRSSGLWIYDPLFRGRTFFPFFTGWSSPYGHGYSHGFGFPWYGRRSYSPFYVPGGFSRGGGPIGSNFRRSDRHRSDDFSNRPHSGRVHHQSTGHRSHGHRRH